MAVPMSEHEQRVLDQLEQEFQPPVDAPSSSPRWSRAVRRRRTAIAAILMPVGMALISLALVVTNPGGIVLAAVGFAFVVEGSALLAESIASARPERRARVAVRPIRYFP